MFSGLSDDTWAVAWVAASLEWALLAFALSFRLPKTSATV